MNHADKQAYTYQKQNRVSSQSVQWENAQRPQPAQRSKDAFAEEEASFLQSHHLMVT